ncbi:hypothetical protein [Paraliomyxa miuraensis]|uniref:hypothetical protein n=1 Tax=Paraliomyxa miuraensis TaxID=376150 RepID=UPI00224CEC03|nr:hypothetical protein [Paraliomyxa miuraensis]MCX4243563.1 hypothetical protein [Paraliomyxa miuraensis]
MRTSPSLASLPLLALCLSPGCGDDSTPGDGSSGDGPTTTASSDDPSSTTDSTDSTDPTASTDGPGPTSGSTGPTSDTEPDSSDTTGSSTAEPVDQVPPTNRAELVPWLESGEYQGWTSESGIHPSAGPHGAGVLTFVNDALLASLEAANPAHPQDAATVKELYDAGGSLVGWAVMVKIQPDSASGDGWYWYEVVDTTVYADGTGEALCTGCHNGGVDYVLTPFPLQ